MKNEIQLNIPFSSWAKETQNQNPEIINQWLKGNDPFKRAMARTILEAASEIKGI